MFYSHVLLSKKGALGIVWMAGHCLKRLKKGQVQQTNVSAAVDKIVDEEVPVVTHRILAFLLLGVVRIYSKKVEYLHTDCQDILNKLCGAFETGKNKRGGSGTPKKYLHSITLPNSFELDEFDLELIQDQDDEDLVHGNVRPNNEITLAEKRGKESNALTLLYKENTALTPPRDVLSPHYMDKCLVIGPSTNMKISSADLAIVPGTGLYLEDRMDPMLLDEDEEEQLQYIASNDYPRAITAPPAEEMTPDSVENLINKICTSVQSWEVLCENRFSVEDHTDRVVLDGKDQGCDESPDNAQPVAVSRRKLLEVVTPDGMDCETADVFLTSLEAPDPMPPDTDSPGVANILTPAAKESGKIQKKRKILLDSTMVLPNVIMKKLIEEDPSDLKRERKMVPKTPLQAWRASKLGHVTPEFTNPLISGVSVDLGFLQCEKSCAGAIAAVEVSVAADNIQSPMVHGVNKQLLEARSPVIERSLEQARLAPRTPISCLIPLRSDEIRVPTDSNILEPTSLAPRTPVSCLIPWRSHEIGAAAGSDFLEHSTSFASIEENASSDGGLELDAAYYEETNSCDADSLENYTFSARTRKLGSYLHGKFMDKNRKNEEEIINVSKLLEGKTKKESARFFFDILVLKTRDCIDVKQESAYAEIMLLEGSKLKQAIEH